MGQTAVNIGANTFAYFTRNPRGGSVKDLDPEDVAGLRDVMDEHGFGTLVAHAPYTLNMASAKPYVREFALKAMQEDLARLEWMPPAHYNFHPGSHVGQGIDEGIGLIAEGLNAVIVPGQRTRVLLETMSGKGSEVGGTFEQIARIIDGVDHDEVLGVCLDTCHVSDAGYDIVNDLDGVLDEFDHVIGLDRLLALHVNDSKNPCGSHKDRHERIGEGTLGLGTFTSIVNEPRLQGLPMILETPNDLAGYTAEIAMLRGMADNEGE
ncbi:MAG: deoxyribonuclease IV [Atopobiaceae bacterium]|jgi:deoxyribonuclease-4|nr:deoxyribonuclease IV [Atopobiaceae bacterium]MCI2207204.1 deoxyribonuclease IV [Atopobiaceae bacterium]